MLGISRAPAYELVRRGVLPKLHLGRRVVVPRRALEDLVSTAGRRYVASGTGSTGGPALTNPIDNARPDWGRRRSCKRLSEQAPVLLVTEANGFSISTVVDETGLLPGIQRVADERGWTVSYLASAEESDGTWNSAPPSAASSA
jgi:hypothetical protein